MIRFLPFLALTLMALPMADQIEAGLMDVAHVMFEHAADPEVIQAKTVVVKR